MLPGRLGDAAGQERASLGVQSFDPSKLDFLERSHRQKDVQRSVDLIRGFTNNFSMDLIFGTPNETLASWNDELEAALSFDPAHLSTYELTIEKGTSFWNRHQKSEFDTVNEDGRCELYELTIEKAEQNGLMQYEISSFAKSGFRCRHNQVYWNGGDYFAFGPGASSYIAGTRNTNHRSTTTYIRRITSGSSAVAESDRLSRNQQAVERLVFGLRQLDGVAIPSFERQFGFSPVSLFGSELETLMGHGLLQISNDRVQLTRRGILLFDEIAVRLLNFEDHP